MLLEVDEAILDATDHRPVFTLLCMVAEKRHDWYPTLAQAVRMADFVERLNQVGFRVPTLAEWAEETTKKAAYPSPPDTRRRVRVSAADLEHLVADLEKPAVLVVENQLADGSFVQEMAAALGDRRVVDAFRRAWLRLHNGGGKGQMVELACNEGKKFLVVTPRVAILFDGDRDGPGQLSDNEDRRAKAHLAGIRHVHIFAYRAVENYVPLSVWEHSFPKQRRKIAGLRALPAHERGYLPKGAYPGSDVPRQLTVADRNVAEADFDELGPDVVAELREILAMIHEIL